MKNLLQLFKNSFSAHWYIWFFPLIAIGISGYLVFSYYEKHGPVIHILFSDAAGIKAEKTRVRYRGMDVGTVRDLYLSEDLKQVVAEVALRKDAASFAVEGSKFSLILPKVDFQGISGLETIFEGTYISVLPGNPNASAQLEFKALADSNTTDPLDETSYYILEATSVESIGPGSAITYKGLKVGSVTKLSLTKDSRLVLVQINLENKYSKLVRINTVFWRKIGVHAKLGLFNSEIKVNSLESIMNGGLEFSTPDMAGSMAKAGQRFRLALLPPKDWEKWNPKLEF